MYHDRAIRLTEYNQALKEINRGKLYLSTNGIDVMKRALHDYHNAIVDTAYRKMNHYFQILLKALRMRWVSY